MLSAVPYRAALCLHEQAQLKYELKDCFSPPLLGTRAPTQGSTQRLRPGQRPNQRWAASLPGNEPWVPLSATARAGNQTLCPRAPEGWPCHSLPSMRDPTDPTGNRAEQPTWSQALSQGFKAIQDACRTRELLRWTQRRRHTGHALAHGAES